MPLWIFSASGVFVISKMKCNNGAKPRCAGSILVTLKSSSGIFFQLRKETVDLVAHFMAAGQTSPMHPNRSEQLEAFVNRRDEIISRFPGAIDQKCLNIGL